MADNESVSSEKPSTSKNAFKKAAFRGRKTPKPSEVKDLKPTATKETPTRREIPKNLKHLSLTRFALT